MSEITTRAEEGAKTERLTTVDPLMALYLDMKVRAETSESRAASAEAEVADLRKSLAACMADLERGGLSKRVYADAALGAELEAAEASASALRDRVAVLEGALKPFAAYAEHMPDWGEGEIGEYFHDGVRISIRTRELRAARAALNGGDHE